MMRARRLFLWCLIVALCNIAGLCNAQQGAPVTLEQIMALWANDAFATPEILNAITNANPLVEFSDSSLTRVFEAAGKGNRPPNEVAQVLMRLLKDCRNCRDQFWPPLGPDDLVALLSKAPDAALTELRVRGIRDLPVSTDFTATLVKAGATPDLIAEVEERIVIPAPLSEGFKPARLEKSPAFNSLATEGKLSLRLISDGDVEFLFRHNALFFRSLQGSEPIILSSTYTGFGPGNSSAPPRLTKSTESRLDGKAPKKTKAAESSITSDTAGRPWLHIITHDIEKDRHELNVELTWTR